MKKGDEIENEVIDQAIERRKKIDEAQLDEDQKEQLQQKLRALQPTPEEEVSGPVDEETSAHAVLNLLDEDDKNVLRAFAQLERGVAQLIFELDEPSRLIDPKSLSTICDLSFYPRNDLANLESYKLVETHSHDLYKITDFGRKVASLSEAE